MEATSGKIGQSKGKLKLDRTELQRLGENAFNRVQAIANGLTAYVERRGGG